MNNDELNTIAIMLVNQHAKKELQEGFELVGLHPYYDQTEKLLYFRCRLKHENGKKWIRPFHYLSLNDEWVMGEPKDIQEKPLYGLLELNNNQQSDVWIVEGEQKVDALVKLGFLATTSGSCSSASSANWEPLRDRNVIIWPDFDEAGLSYTQDIVKILQTLNCFIHCIDVKKLNLLEKGDVIDWLKLNPTATPDDILALPLIDEPCSKNDNEKGGTLSTQPRERVDLIRAINIKPEPIAWIWKEWIAAGKMHIFGGTAGTGKTTISMALAATVTSGGLWPDNSRCKVGNVVIWSGEDDPKDTLTPRLIQSGADLSRVYFIDGVVNIRSRRSFDPASDMELLRVKLEKLGDVSLVIIDPIVSAIIGDSHKNAEVRRGLQPLVDMASIMNFALLGITHFTKGTSGREPVERITGSLAFSAIARIILVATKQQNKGCHDIRLFLRAKSNIGVDNGGFEYELKNGELDTYPGVFTSSVLWGKKVLGSAQQLLTNAETPVIEHKSTALSEAKDFLVELLSKGPMLASLIKDHAEGEDHSWASIKRAKKLLGIKPNKETRSNGSWVWKLPSTEDGLVAEPQKMLNNLEDAQQNNVSTFDKIEHLSAASKLMLDDVLLV